MIWSSDSSSTLAARAICLLSAIVMTGCAPRAEIAPEKLKFSGERAFGHLKKQVEFGPRVPESVAIAQTREYVLTHLAANGWTTGTQDFTAYSTLLESEVRGQNLYAYKPGSQPGFIAVSAHYDCRPVSDMESDENLRKQPVPGANDGASGVAVLLELARVVDLTSGSPGVALLFFDLEDHGTSSKLDGFCLGAKAMASNLPSAIRPIKQGINLDMVGDAQLTLKPEMASLTNCKDSTKRFWEIGHQLYPQIFIKQIGTTIVDDHVPFIAAGIPYMDVIDLEYPDWHRTTDSPDKCSAGSLEAVGRTVEAFICH